MCSWKISMCIERLEQSLSLCEVFLISVSELPVRLFVVDKNSSVFLFFVLMYLIILLYTLDNLYVVQWFFSISSSYSLAAVVFWNQKQLITIGRFWVWTQTQTWKLTKWATSSFLRLKCITQNIINEMVMESQLSP